MKVRYRPTAVAQLDAIFTRIAANNPAAAEKIDPYRQKVYRAAR